jgi:hypothetical protein
MPYVLRDSGGAVVALLARPEISVEELPADHPDVVAFLGGGQSALAASDSGMARVAEDLIDLLIADNIINFTELPEQAQQKLLVRRAMRKGEALDLGLIDSGEVI